MSVQFGGIPLPGLGQGPLEVNSLDIIHSLGVPRLAQSSRELERLVLMEMVLPIDSLNSERN